MAQSSVVAYWAPRRRKSSLRCEQRDAATGQGSSDNTLTFIQLAFRNALLPQTSECVSGT